jgi:hypothetical protein
MRLDVSIAAAFMLFASALPCLAANISTDVLLDRWYQSNGLCRGESGLGVLSKEGQE